MSEPTLDAAILVLIVIAILPLCGLIFALTPYLMKKSEVFAVTVPESAIYDPYLKKLKRHYLVIVLVLTLILTLPTVLFFVGNLQMQSVICMVIGSFFIVGFSYALMLYYRKKVSSYKKAQGWEATRKEAVAVIMDQDIPKAVSLRWNLLYIPIFCVTALIGYLGYDAMPAQIPMQMGLDGSVSNWMEKSPLVIWVPVFIELFFALCFVAAHWAIVRSKRISDPSAPAASAFAYGMFAHAQSLYLVSGGLVMAAAMVAMPLAFMGVLEMLQAGALVALAAFVLVLGAIGVSVVYGQGGARVFRHMQESNELLADDDRFWKLGVFYFNPDDPNWFLPARFGIGWTCNFARPVVWVLTFGIIILSVVFVVALFAIV